ncbi:MAG: hypothetical protein AAF709_00960, partial [Pseudomonadota bacterium]
IVLPAVPRALDDSVSLSSSEIRSQLYNELKALDAEINELVKAKAQAYFPNHYSVFTRTHLDDVRNIVTTELWVVDPTIRWPAGLLTRSAWRLFIPVMGHVVRDAFAERITGAAMDVREGEATITVLAPTRGWRDPIILSGIVLVLTTVFWLLAWPFLQQYVAALLGSG